MRRSVCAAGAGAVAFLVGTSVVLAPAASSYPSTYSRQRCGNTTSQRVMITFDDWNDADPHLATRTGDHLRSKGIRAAYFLNGKDAARHPDIVRTLRDQGHYVGNHGTNHRNLTGLTDAQVRAEIAGGVKSNVLRPPHGAWDDRVRDIAAGMGYRICTWTVSTRDWERVNGSLRSTTSIRGYWKSAPPAAKAGGNILGHLWTNYPKAVAGLIADVHAEGRLFCRNRGPVPAGWPTVPACT
ncbi:polysaccharide deacetylase family protein [Streptomyces pactum]|uniref:Polysaccharide deacetylase family protein n=1 Tax=Streptomyces pactum TaxID=68249 RepID=A0ABS0NSE7_9ACTN|nr:polysaccharide deacetylase family protein [Streptomyces pactum]MBH5338139.1 polysaccharide deacetylase family protein [Streptomyces pactum]